jgi:DNA polymerase-3 subunit alpha (Gram-positive type)
MNITEVNPMPPHYFCKKCGYIEWVDNFDDGFDLPKKQCSCGNDLTRDGHKIPFETFLGFEGDKIPD